MSKSAGILYGHPQIFTYGVRKQCHDSVATDHPLLVEQIPGPPEIMSALYCTKRDTYEQKSGVRARVQGQRLLVLLVRIMLVFE